MAALPLEAGYFSGKTIYAILHNPNGQVWNNSTLLFEAFNATHWGNYAIVLTEQGTSGYYSAAYPSAIDITIVITTDILYQQLGGSPVLTDQLIGVGKTQGVNVSSIAGNLAATVNMSFAAGTEVRGASIAGTLTQTQMTTNLTNSLTGAFVGRSIIWTSGVLQNVAAAIVAYDGTAKLVTYSPVPTAPGVGDTFVIV